MSTQQDIYAAGLKTALLCLTKRTMFHGHHVFFGDANREVPVPETFHEQTDDELTVAEIKQMEADDQACYHDSPLKHKIRRLGKMEKKLSHIIREKRYKREEIENRKGGDCVLQNVGIRLFKAVGVQNVGNHRMGKLKVLQLAEDWVILLGTVKSDQGRMDVAYLLKTQFVDSSKEEAVNLTPSGRTESSENDSNVISDISSVEQEGGTVDQHPATVEETRAYFESLYNNLALEVEKRDSAKRGADESLAKHKALELEIERLLRAVVSQDIMAIVQNPSVVDSSNLQTELECTKERFENYNH
ncbi:hypothetical protein Tco_0796652 [Tanacetum coccineum]